METAFARLKRFCQARVRTVVKITLNLEKTFQYLKLLIVGTCIFCQKFQGIPSEN